MQWFRFWDNTLESKKAQDLDGATFKRWVNLMCLANRQTPRGTLPDIEEIRFALRVSRLSVVSLLSELVERGLVDELPDRFRMHNWEKWQRPSDVSTDRVHRFRKRDETVSETDVKRSVTVLEQNRTEQIQNRAEQTGPHPPATAFTFWGKALLVTQADLVRWTAAYQPVDVLGELRRLEAWAVENRRDYRDVRRFVVNNLSRARSRLAANGPVAHVPLPRPDVLEAPELSDEERSANLNRVAEMTAEIAERRSLT